MEVMVHSENDDSASIAVILDDIGAFFNFTTDVQEIVAISLNKAGSDGLCIDGVWLDEEEIGYFFWLDDDASDCTESTTSNPSYHCYGTEHTI